MIPDSIGIFNLCERRVPVRGRQRNNTSSNDRSTPQRTEPRCHRYCRALAQLQASQNSYNLHSPYDDIVPSERITFLLFSIQRILIRFLLLPRNLSFNLRGATNTHQYWSFIPSVYREHYNTHINKNHAAAASLQNHHYVDFRPSAASPVCSTAQKQHC